MQAYESGKYTWIKQFVSKKNQVNLIAVELKGQEQFLIEKKFSEIKSLERELFIVKHLENHKIKTIECFGRHENVLLYEYIDGVTLCEWMEQAEPDKLKQNDKEMISIDENMLTIFKETINYLESFHKATGLVFYDVNLRNFIIREGGIVAIDYEDVRETDFSVDYGRLLAYILTYNPSFTFWKKELVQQLECYLKRRSDASFRAVCDQKDKELESIRRRRGRL